MGEVAQMDPAEAEAVVLNGIYVPQFVEKCAALGVNFPDEDSLRTALETVQMLKAAEAEESVDIVKEAHAALMGTAGLEAPEVTAAREAEEAAAGEKAAAVASDDLIKKALASLAAQK